MIPRAWLAGVAGLVVAAMWATWSAVPARPVEVPPRPPLPVAVGSYVAGCAASGCHGDAPVAGQPAWKSSASVWRMSDKHAGAYVTLLSEKSKRIAKLLHGDDRAHLNQACLDCHGHPAGPSASAEGVGCESCHGKADGYLFPHQRFRAEKASNRKNYEANGMRWLNDMDSRAKACVGCHVGEAGREVSHDLIAAGHPRLNFEFATYLRAMPPHWDEQDRPTGKAVPAGDVPVQAWAAGQTATMDAALSLLESRSGRGWPEFAEMNCYDCHHDLKDGRDVPPVGGKRGRAGWYKSHELRRLSDGGADLLAVMGRRVTSPEKVKSGIAKARAGMKPPPRAADALLAWLKPPAGDMHWDEAAWHYHGLAALETARRASGGEVDAKADALFGSLREGMMLESGVATPRRFRPAQPGLGELWKHLSAPR